MRGRYLVLFMAVIFVSCKSEYQSYVDRELAKNEYRDSLIFGMRMGDTKKDFYSICWDLNKSKVISEGTGNRYAKYIERDSLIPVKKRKIMEFYGIFDEQDTMRGMDMIYNYQAWAPWNEESFSDVLMEDLKEILEEEYEGNPFIDIDIEEKGVDAAVKIDGNRQILIYPKNKKDVSVKITDLNYTLEK